MKRMPNPFKLILPVFLLLQLGAVAQNDNNNDNDNTKETKKYDFTKNKAVNKSYTVSSSDKLDIKNSFGTVEVHTWNKNEIKVDVDVQVSANSESLAQKILDGINITDDRSGSTVWFKTDIKGVNNTGNAKSTMKINYSISMPASNPLHISNEFGKTIVPDFKGEVDLTSKFGSLNTGSLGNVKSVDVEFGKAKLGAINNGDISIKYSKAELSGFSGNVKLNVEFSTATQISIDNNLTGLNVKASYSTVNVKPMANFSASYSISTSFGDFKNRTDVKFDGDDKDNEHGVKFDHNYNGKSGSGTVPVKIKADFGNIILGEPGPDDMKHKDKDKHKDKEKTS